MSDSSPDSLTFTGSVGLATVRIEAQGEPARTLASGDNLLAAGILGAIIGGVAVFLTGRVSARPRLPPTASDAEYAAERGRRVEEQASREAAKGLRWD